MTAYKGSDIYCDLIIPRKVPIIIIKETKNVIAFHHTKPHWPVHIVVTCKQHVPSLLELKNGLAIEMLNVIKEVAKSVNSKEGASRILTNLGDYQDSKHLHVHICSGTPLLY
jgi:histidine triad (HIT) family protein